jgi:RHS repeat-associated protein
MRSTRQLASTAGALTDNFVYDSFGDALFTSGTAGTPFRYVGRAGCYLDSDIVTYCLRARYYSPGAGRFLSRDPMSSYAYVESNPVLSINPSGFDDTPMKPIKKPPQRPRPDPPRSIGTSWDYLGWGYGWYCGLSRKGPPRGWIHRFKPIDPLDASCQKHDSCLAQFWWDFCDPYKQFTCDFVLCNDAQIALASGCSDAYPTSDPYDLYSLWMCMQAARDLIRLYCTLTIRNPSRWKRVYPIHVPYPFGRFGLKPND